MRDTARCASAPGGANARQNGGHTSRRRPPLHQVSAVRGQLSLRGLYYNTNDVYRLAEYTLRQIHLASRCILALIKE